MLDSPLVSVIIPCFNHARFVLDAIESCRRQTYRHIEIIVVDDGSSDESAEIVRGCDSIAFIAQRNAGPAVARNAGLAVSSGEFVCFLDADDRLRERAVEQHLSELEQSASGWSYCASEFIDESGELMGGGNGSFHRGDMYHELKRGNWLQPGRVMVRRECLRSVGDFDPQFFGTEDWDLWLRLAREFPVVSVSQPLLEYRVLDGSVSSNSLRMMEGRIRVHLKHRRAHGKCQECQRIHRQVMSEYAGACKLAGWEAQQAGSWSAARSWYGLAARTDPRVLLGLSTVRDLASLFSVHRGRA